VLCILNEECWFSGDNESGKTTLVSKLQGVEDQKKGSALEFMYVTVRDEYGDGELYVHKSWVVIFTRPKVSFYSAVYWRALTGLTLFVGNTKNI